MGPIDFLEDIVGIPSLSGAEEKVALRLAEEFEKLGYDDIIHCGGNVCGVRGSGSVKVLYDAHTDVVDPGTGWETDPFSAENDGERVTGRGSCDDKGVLASMVYGGGRADVEGVTLYVLGSVKEEVSAGNGIRDFLSKTGVRPDFAVIGEPSKLKVSLGNRGRVALKIDMQGRAGHASDPGAGVNAVYRAAETAVKIKELHKRVSLMGDSAVVTRISTPERNINIIPEKCSLWVDYRSAPGRKLEDITGLFDFISGEDIISEVTHYYRPWTISEESPLVKAALAAAGESGVPAETTFWDFCTNASFTAGELEIPTIGFGPGREEDCHTAGESVSISEVLSAVEFFRCLPGHIKSCRQG